MSWQLDWPLHPTHLAAAGLVVGCSNVRPWRCCRPNHDPQRAHLSMGYTVEEYKTLIGDMITKVEDIKNAAGEPKVPEISRALMFRWASLLQLAN